MAPSDESDTRRETAAGGGRYGPTAPIPVSGNPTGTADARRQRALLAAYYTSAPLRPRARRDGHHASSRQASRVPIRVVIDAQQSVRVVQSHLLGAEDRLRSGHVLEAGHNCRAALSAVRPIMAVEPELHATALAVHAHVAVAAGSAADVEAVRRYYAVAVDQAVAGVWERLVYASGLKAALLARTRPTLAADALTTLLLRHSGPEKEMLERALLAVHDLRRGAASASVTSAPLIPGGVRVSIWAPPHPDCLAWLIRATARDLRDDLSTVPARGLRGPQ